MYPEFDLISLIEKDLGPGRKSGRWVMYPCPFHNDRHPSFGVTNGEGKRGPYWRCWATGCDKRGGPLGWLIEYHGMTKDEALAALRDDHGPGPTRQREDLPIPEPDTPPGPAWQKRAAELTERAQAALWGEPGHTSTEWAERDPLTGETITRHASPLDWLFSRGLAESTLRLWSIGYIPHTFKDDSAQWGLAGKPVWIPKGILIPCLVSNQTWYLKIRQPHGTPKYIHVRRSQKALYMLQTLEFSDKAVFCEGELDALLLWQEASELAAVVTLGSAGNPLNVANWGFYLLHTPIRFIAYDADPAGQAGSDKLAWLNPHRLNVPKLAPYDKDITDYYKSGGDLRAWLTSEIARLHPREATSQ